MAKSAEKTLVLLGVELKTPPLSKQARIEIGYLLRQLQMGSSLSMPSSRPMPTLGARCHELRVNDQNRTWRVVYRNDPDAILVAAVFSKKTNQTPKSIIKNVKAVFRRYDQ